MRPIRDWMSFAEAYAGVADEHEVAAPVRRILTAHLP
jgi:hypothetical protein